MIAQLDMRIKAGDLQGVRVGLEHVFRISVDCVAAQHIEADMWFLAKDYEQVG